MAGIQLFQPNGAGTLNSAGAQHPAPVTIEAGLICQLSFVGGTTSRYRWALSKPAASASVLSSTTSAGPSFVPDIDDGSYSISLFDIDENEYILDIVTPTSGSGGGGGGGTVATTVENYGDVRAATFGASTPPAVFLLKCREATDDGGGGEFAYDPEDTTTPDDDGTVLVDSDGHRFKRIFDGPISALWFGMASDGREVDGNVSVTGASTTIGFSGSGLSEDDVGKVIQIRTPNSPATGTVATVSATALTGTVTTVEGEPEIVGAGTLFTSELWVGAHIKIGTRIGQVVEITDNTHIRTNQYFWNSSASGLSASKYGIVGASTAFEDDLFVGQGIYIDGTFYTVQAIADDTHAAVWPLPAASASGKTCYTAPLLAGVIASVNESGHTAVLSSLTAAVPATASGLSAYVGTDNSSAFDAARAAASAAKRTLEIPGSTGQYLFFDGITPLSDTDRGLHILGHGWGLEGMGAFGSLAWDPIDSGAEGTVLRFLTGNGIVADDDAVYSLHVENIALIGPGSGATSQGFGILPGHEVSGAQGGDVYSKLLIANWGIGWSRVNAFGSLADTIYARGNGTGITFENCNGQEFIGNCEFSNDGIGLRTINSGLSYSLINANFQGCYVWGCLLTSITSVRFSKCYFESNPVSGLLNGGMGNAFMYDMTGGGTIQELTWDACHVGDVYHMQPVAMYPSPTGVINAIDDSTSDFASMVVRPIWINWRPSKHYTAVDLRYSQGGIDAIGSGSLGHTRMPAISPTSVVGPTTYSPDIADGVLRVLIVSGGDVLIDTPTAYGTALHAYSPPDGTTQHFELEFHVRLAGAFAVTWSAAFDGHNPWTNDGAATGARAVIRFRHTGSGNWECVYYQPYGNSLVRYGAGTPEGNVSAPVGTIYCQTDGASNSTLWTKVSGSGSTLWESVTTSNTATNIQRVARGIPFIYEADSDIDEYGRVIINTTAGTVVKIPVDVPNGATLTDILMRVAGPSNVALPAVMPRFRLRKLDGSTNTATSSSAQVDASGTVGAYNAQHSITMNSIGEVIDNTIYRYMIEFVSESGANAATGFTIISTEIYYTVTTPDKGAA